MFLVNFNDFGISIIILYSSLIFIAIIYYKKIVLRSVMHCYKWARCQSLILKARVRWLGREWMGISIKRKSVRTTSLFKKTFNDLPCILCADFLATFYGKLLLSLIFIAWFACLVNKETIHSFIDTVDIRARHGHTITRGRSCLNIFLIFLI